MKVRVHRNMCTQECVCTCVRVYACVCVCMRACVCVCSVEKEAQYYQCNHRLRMGGSVYGRIRLNMVCVLLGVGIVGLRTGVWRLVYDRGT